MIEEKIPSPFKRLLYPNFTWAQHWYFCTKEQIGDRGITWVHTKQTRLAQRWFLFAPATLETKDGMTTKAMQKERLNLQNIWNVFLWGNSSLVFQDGFSSFSVHRWELSVFLNIILGWNKDFKVKIWRADFNVSIVETINFGNKRREV